MDRLILHQHQELFAGLHKNALVNSSKGAIVRTFDGCCTFAVEKDRKFAKIISLVQCVAFLLGDFLLVFITYAALTISYEIKMVTFFALFNNYVIRLH